MEALLQPFKDAHKEVMGQTGWGHMLANLTDLVRSAPAVARSLRQEAAFFRFSVNWCGEPFFKCLLLFHLVVAGVAAYLALWRWRPARSRPAGVTRAMELASSRAEEKLFALSMALLLLAFGAYPLNSLGAAYGHMLFVEPNVNYFDDNVVFIAVVYWFPLVVLSLLVQLKLLFNVLRLMVLAKAEQLKMRQKASERMTAEDAKAVEADKKKN